MVGAAIGSPRLQLGLLSVLDECLGLESGLDGLGVDCKGVQSGFFRDDLVCGLDGYEVNCTCSLGMDCNREHSGVDCKVDCKEVQSTLAWGDGDGLIVK